MIKTGIGLAAAAAVCGLTLFPAGAEDGRLFERLAGTWSGTGTARVSTGGDEPIRCRADYAPSGPSSLRLSLRCASDSFNLQISSEIARQGDRVSGSWSEANTGVSGDVSGRVGADRIDATVDGAGLSARLGLTLRGNTQSVTLVSDGPLASSASVVLRGS